MNINNPNNVVTSSHIDVYAHQLLSKTNTTQSDYLLIEPYSIGDVFHTLTLLNEFKKKYCKPEQKINFICNHRAVPIIKFFGNVNNVLGMDCSHFHMASLAERYNVCMPGVPIITAPDMYARGYLARLVMAGKISNMDAKKLLLELDLNTMPLVPNLNSQLSPIATEKAISQGLTEQSIIIFNHATCLKSLNPDVFLTLKKYFGDSIFYDATMGDKGKIPWAKPLTMSIDDVPYFVNYAGSAISIRSGITDVLALTNADIYTIYPNSVIMMDFFANKIEMANAFKRSTLYDFEIYAKDREVIIQLQENDNINSIGNKIDQAISYKNISVTN
jgi:hypothetical protein